MITGNTYLAMYSKTYNPNVLVFPSTIDLDYYRVPIMPKTAGNKITIGWSGSHTTVEHFETIIPVLKTLKKKFGSILKFEVYGDPHYKNDDLEIQGMAWSAESEVTTIAAFDIGIMPLPDDNWSKGKCAMKGLQYMGLNVPAVLAAVGMNKDVIEDGVNGFLAGSEEEWIAKLTLLIESKDLRSRIGCAGRKTIEEKFSAQALRNRYLDIFQQALKP